MSISTVEDQIFLSEMPDELIIEMVQQGDDNASDFLINKYRYFVRMKARKFYLMGGDKEDVIQEGLIGLYKAIRDFKSDKMNSFKSFAELCITRQIMTAVKTATRQKHTPLNTYLSFDKPFNEGEPDQTILDIISDKTISDPIVLIIDKEETKGIESIIQDILSPLEQRVLELYLEDRSYNEISNIMDIRIKSIDNAMQRVKKKLENYLLTKNKVH